MALNLVRNARVALGQAQNAAERYDYDLGGDKLEAIVMLKAKLEQLEYIFASQASLHEAEYQIKISDRDPNARLAKGFKLHFQAVIDALGIALTHAVHVEDYALQARINAKLGFVVYECLHKTEEEELPLLKKASFYFTEMRKVVGQYMAEAGAENSIGEPWFLVAEA